MPKPNQLPPLLTDHAAAAPFLRGGGQEAAGGALQGLLRELIDEIIGLRKDLRSEILRREIDKLPKPIRE